MKKFALIIPIVLALTACNTVAGVGKDVEAGGRAVSNAAYKVQSKM